jgi:uncharacterized protein (TIGR03085 family)
MTQETLAKRERRELAELLVATGPDAATLCEGWTTRDLAAHLVVRENRPDAALGLVATPLAGHMERVREDATEREYSDLVETIANGPSRFSPFAFPGVDALANTAEYLVHHEDVRRAQPTWEPRQLDDADANQIWRELPRYAAITTRGLKVGLVAEHPDGRVQTLAKGTPVAVMVGEPLEIVLYLYGRRAVARVELKGDPIAVAAVSGADLST